MRKILIPTDFSSTSFNAAKYALALSEQVKSKIILFHTYESPDLWLEVPFSERQYGKYEARENAISSLQKFSARLNKLFPRIKIHLVTIPGVASSDIINYASRNHVDFIIMGTTGKGAVSRVLLGSNTNRVIQKAVTNIIVVPPKARFKGVEKIGVVCDMNSRNTNAYKEVVFVAKMLKSAIQFVHVKEDSILNPDRELSKMKEKIVKHVSFRKASFFLIEGPDMVTGITKYIAKQKPGLISLVNNKQAYPALFWKKSTAEKLTGVMKIPLLVLNDNKN